MNCYIEYAILNNLTMDFLIVKTTLKILRLSTKRYRILLCILFGTCFSCVLPLIKINAYLSLFFKVVSACVMLLILIKHKDFKSYLITLFSFLIITFLYGGFCYVIVSIFNKKANISTTNFPIFIILLLCFFVYKLIFFVYLSIKKRKDITEFLYDIEIFLNGKSVKTRAFLDTGNRLYDKKSLEPICVLEVSVLFKILDANEIFKLFMDKKCGIKNSDFNVSFLNNGQEKMKLICLDKIKIYLRDKVNTIENIVVAVCFKKLFDELDYKMLIHRDILDGNF